MVGERINYLAKQKGVTPYRIAKDAKISESYLSELLNSKRSNPSLSILRKIASALNVSVEELIK